ncbi:MAG TPA: thiopeptide-type bacteriocin biosynthesis protein [Polyangia bacterium]|nr:thiopeptide-type bacteriocin biosynthesis protein [Polyangia bacterium]
MPLRVISRWLLRAPLLPVAALERPARGAFAFAGELGALALELGAPALARAKTAEAARALENYARRAAYRPTPHRLWAGVSVGKLGARTRIATGGPRAYVTVSWARLAALGRALLDDARVRDAARLRAAPSLLRGETEARWLAFGDGAEAVAGAAELDDALAAVLDATIEWRGFAEVRAALARVEPADADALDDYLLRLVDDGLLAHDLEPPLVGPPPLEWMLARLGESPSLAEIRAALAGVDARASVSGARAALNELPGATDAEPLHAVLVHEASAVVSRAAVERAAAIAPLLFRVQEALAPPAAERALDGEVDQALESATEIFGAGAFDLGALARGEYGAPLDAEAPPPERAAHWPLARWLVDRLLAAVAAGEPQLELDARDLDALAPPADAPPSFELILTPMREPRGAPPGTGWLVGLHAPAGATWGRFAAALGAPLAEALTELAAAERSARPGETRLDVAYAPSRALGDVTAHPPVRAAALALSSWPAGEAVTPAELELCADRSALAAPSLRRGSAPVVPSPLERVRSTTAPPGAWRWLAASSLYRQHAPWALALGPLADLAYWPRVAVDGMVVSPASWRAPPLDSPAAFRRWRRAAGVPRWVQLGHEDELLPIDLEARGAFEQLRREAPERLWEIWPPLDAGVDAGGRRVEAVVAVIDLPDGARAEAQAAAIANLGRVPPPRVAPPAAGWSTFKIFGAAERADRVLVGAVAPAVEAARDAGELDGWFFLRYVDGPGRRAHLRLRVHAARDPERDPARFAARLADALAPARACGDVVSVETADYFRETARYGEGAMDAVERVFESDSVLACEALAADSADGEADAVELAVRDFDAIAAGFGLALDERHALAARRRAAYAPERDAASPLAADFRRRQSRLHAALAAPDERFAAHRDRVARAIEAVPRERRPSLLPPILHLASVRLAGPDRALETAAFYHWERALEGLVRRTR